MKCLHIREVESTKPAGNLDSTNFTRAKEQPLAIPHLPSSVDPELHGPKVALDSILLPTFFFRQHNLSLPLDLEVFRQRLLDLGYLKFLIATSKTDARSFYDVEC